MRLVLTRKCSMHFAFIQEHTQLLTVKYRIGAAVSFSVTMQVTASLLEQAINMFTITIHCTSTTVMMENHNG